jgi:transposase-like protein
MVNVATVIATVVTAPIKREVLGLDADTNKDGAGGKAFLHSLLAREALRG